MQARDIISMIGAFCTGFGTLLMSMPVERWAWWLGQVMVIAGPILMGARALTSTKKPSEPQPPEKLN